MKTSTWKKQGELNGTQTAAIYLRVSTSRQAEKNLSIPDQRRQVETYCAAKGWQIVKETKVCESCAPEVEDSGDSMRALLKPYLDLPPGTSEAFVEGMNEERVSG